MSETTRTATAQAGGAGFKPKKSVALSGVTAGNTALCTVGRTGNDLHYRGYDILELANACEFEEVAHLLVHETLPTRARLAAYKAKLRALRGLPANLKAALEWIPASAHPMDVMRTGVSVLGTVLPEKDDHNPQGARDIADRLLAASGVDAAVLVSLRLQRQAHRNRNRRRFDRRPFPASAAWRRTVEVVGQGDAYVAEPVRRTRVQCVDLRRPRDRRHGLGYLFGHYRRDRRIARPEAWRRQ